MQESVISKGLSNGYPIPGAERPSSIPLTRDWRGILEPLSCERSFTPLEVNGNLPLEVSGTFLRNGPANTGHHGRTYAHWFDGDGAVTGVRFSHGKAYGATQLVKTPEYIEEQQAGRCIYPGFGTLGKGFRKRTKLKNVANTNLLHWQNRLFALWEGGLPTELRMDDLDTVGRTNLDGVLSGAFSAHPHRVHSRKAIYNFGVNLGLRPSLDLYELPDHGPPKRLQRVRLSENLMLHDFIVTEQFAVFLVSPVFLKTVPFLLGKGSFAANLSWTPQQGTEVICIPLDEPEDVYRFYTEPFYQWHFANAFDQNGHIHIDFVRFNTFQLVGWADDLTSEGKGLADFGELVRATVDPAKRTFHHRPLASTSCEFPTVAPWVTGRRHQFVYCCQHSKKAKAEGGLFDQIAKIDVMTSEIDSYTFDNGCVGSEPIFVPRANRPSAEDDGYLMCLVYEPWSHTSHVLVFDAKQLHAGPMARVQFPEHIPYTFHGIWVPGNCDA